GTWTRYGRTACVVPVWAATPAKGKTPRTPRTRRACQRTRSTAASLRSAKGDLSVCITRPCRHGCPGSRVGEATARSFLSRGAGERQRGLLLGADALRSA